MHSQQDKHTHTLARFQMYAMCMKPFNGSRFNLGAKEAKKIEPRKKPLSKLIALDFFFERVNEPTNQTCVHLDREMARIYINA